MRRFLVGSIGLYILAGVATTAAEAAGVGRRCGCPSDCWCQRPGLRFFRWVTPVGHRPGDPVQKEAMARP
jgi:hypothetical protein